MTTDRIACAGFSPSRGDRLPRRYAVMAQLVATLALVISLIVSGTAVSIGIARADNVTHADGATPVKLR